MARFNLCIGNFNLADRNHVEAAVATTYRCPLCGGALELMEDGRYLWFGCWRCKIYVRREKGELAKKFVDYRRRRFMWSQMMEELYRIFMSPVG
ncbi:hypothetical protein Pcal_0571 [Pyrobaculum calidifontis JCM 11548]|uniref:Uncharacterized protein n=1 Tax=Pyrobaculum calidifontis (strain DSM 21063 / JCM 11548 / VA1) TaxID=410359 RepID=A3MTN1_PYRCJ|nr:hypothetical protein Pcal_0571 [Pyrobaculum calidifontis JCM 11548]